MQERIEDGLCGVEGQEVADGVGVGGAVVRLEGVRCAGRGEGRVPLGCSPPP